MTTQMVLLSSMASWCPLNKQVALLRTVVETWPPLKHAFVAEKKPAMFRALAKHPTEATIYVATLAVISRSETDFRRFLSDLRAAKTNLVSVKEDLHVSHKNDFDDDLVGRWKTLRAEGKRQVGQLPGARASAARRSAASQAGAEKIRTRWPLPSRAHPTADLLQEAGISLNTAKRLLGSRPVAQKAYRATNQRAQNALLSDLLGLQTKAKSPPVGATEVRLANVHHGKVGHGENTFIYASLYAVEGGRLLVDATLDFVLKEVEERGYRLVSEDAPKSN